MDEHTNIEQTITLHLSIEQLRTIISEEVKKSIEFLSYKFMEPEETLLTTKGVCELLHTTPVQIWRWETAGYFSSKKMGGKKFYSKKEVIEGMRKTRKYSEVQ